VAELADAPVSKTGDSNIMWVRFPPSAPSIASMEYNDACLKHVFKGGDMKKKVLGLIGALEIELEGADDIAVLKLSGQIDSYTAQEIKKIIDTHIDQGKCKIIVDLSHVDYLDSMGLSVFINAKTRLGQKTGDIRLAGLRGKAKDVFELAGLTNLFNLFDSREQAFHDF
jgi:anti-sigma B factor antagonist